jgi:hypothetical protein
LEKGGDVCDCIELAETSLPNGYVEDEVENGDEDGIGGGVGTEMSG